MGTVVAQWGMAALFAVSVILVMLATVFAASLLGITGLATLQVALSVFSLLACVCDSLAISGQAIAGHGLGVARTDRVLLITRRLVRFGVLAGMPARVVMAVLSPVLGRLFTSDEQVNRAFVAMFLVMAMGVPLAGSAFQVPAGSGPHCTSQNSGPALHQRRVEPLRDSVALAIRADRPFPNSKNPPPTP